MDSGVGPPKHSTAKFRISFKKLSLLCLGSVKSVILLRRWSLTWSTFLSNKRISKAWGGADNKCFIYSNGLGLALSSIKCTPKKRVHKVSRTKIITGTCDENPSIRMTETRFYEPAWLSTPDKPLFSLKPLDATTWLRSFLSKVFPPLSTEQHLTEIFGAYRKIPKISPGAYIFQRPFLRGLFSEGLIYGGKFVSQNRLG